MFTRDEDTLRTSVGVEADRIDACASSSSCVVDETLTVIEKVQFAFFK